MFPAELPSLGRIATVWTLVTFAATALGLFLGAIVDFVTGSTEWADKLFNLAWKWAVFGVGVAYFFKWLGLA